MKPINFNVSKYMEKYDRITVKECEKFAFKAQKALMIELNKNIGVSERYGEYWDKMLQYFHIGE